ncbi:GTPase ObgE [Neoactinobaculum massilliense]|uniref:GTPase ObgE n=1 Tax=Neoactinobaculum massilliense TaxID=2364794 RepID=UPI000F520C8C|nr:GTPase ObgE [Neoactinobaculum massilliense]
MASFIDHVTLHLAAGNGGNGVASVKREKYKPLGGPDGANGGNGGSIILEVDQQVSSLLDLHFQPHQKAANGEPGGGDFQRGKNGPDLILKVPSGTVVKTPAGEPLADLVVPGDQFVAARGGAGGLGNAALATQKRKAPGFALLGEPGQEVDVVLELKLVADVALVGFPSAGKSSLVSVLSAAKPKIADYPFTTLVPNLGVVMAGDSRFTIADVPGLIPGASEGKGLGLEFLRHIERCSVIVHVIDCATLEPGRDPKSDMEALEAELASYADRVQATPGLPPLMERPRVVVLNKMDVPEARELADMVTESFVGMPVVKVSTATHEGLDSLKYLLAEIVSAAHAAMPAPEPGHVVLHPAAQDTGGFTVKRAHHDGQDFWQVRGRKPERWVLQTDFNNDEAVGYLADRLATLGIEDRLVKQGAKAGDMVVIGPADGGFVFDWEPNVGSAAEVLGARGEDERLRGEARRTNQERRVQYKEMMDAKARARENLAREREAGIWTDPGESD